VGDASVSEIFKLLIDVVVDVETLGSLVGSLVLAQLSIRVGLGSLEEGLLGSREVIAISLPSIQSAGLEGSSVREREAPWLREVGSIHGIQVSRSLFLRLSSRKEHDAGNGGRDGSLENGDGGSGDLFGSDRLVFGRGVAGGDHVGLEQSSLQQDLVVMQSLDDDRQDSLGGLNAVLERVLSVHQDLGLNDGNESVLLADGSISSQTVGILQHGKRSGAALLGINLEHGSPLGKSSSGFVELLASSSEIVQSQGGGLLGSVGNDGGSLVDLDANLDAQLVEHLSKGGSISSLLEQSLLVQDHSRDVVLESLRSEEEFSVVSSVVLVVLDGNLLESLPNGSSGLISSEDSMSSGCDEVRRLDEFVSKFGG